MKDVEAMALFGGKGKLNCAQATTKVFQSVSGMSDKEILAFSSAGFGKAPGAVCGAVHAARVLLDDPVVLRGVETAFECKTGSLLCKKILKLKKLSCKKCVGLAARLLGPRLA